MVKNHAFGFLRILSVICLCAMVIAILMQGFWLLLAMISWGAGPIPRVDAILWLLLGISLVTTCLFFRYPWLAVMTAWVDLALILLGVIPWVDHSFKTFTHQFVYDNLFFVAANLGALALMFGRRSQGEIAS